MSTTTKAPLCRRTGVLLFACLAVLTAWFAAVAIATLAFEPFPRVVVLGPRADVLEAVVASNVLMITGGSGFQIAQGTKAGFVGRLYAGGAWLVLPSSSGSCLSLSRWKTAGRR